MCQFGYEESESSLTDINIPDYNKEDFIEQSLISGHDLEISITDGSLMNQKTEKLLGQSQKLMPKRDAILQVYQDYSSCGSL